LVFDQFLEILRSSKNEGKVISYNHKTVGMVYNSSPLSTSTCRKRRNSFGSLSKYSERNLAQCSLDDADPDSNFLTTISVLPRPKESCSVLPIPKESSPKRVKFVSEDFLGSPPSQDHQLSTTFASREEAENPKMYERQSAFDLYPLESGEEVVVHQMSYERQDAFKLAPSRKGKEVVDLVDVDVTLPPKKFRGKRFSRLRESFVNVKKQVTTTIIPNDHDNLLHFFDAAIDDIDPVKGLKKACIVM